MANNIALTVMANIAAKNGYAPVQAQPEEGRQALHLGEEEQALLRRAIAGEGDCEKATAPKAALPKRGVTAVMSLEEMAGKKR